MPHSPNTPKAIMREINDWFGAHPEREFRLTALPMTHALASALSRAGWIAGSATSAGRPGHGINAPDVPSKGGTMCIIRRAAPEEGRPLPGVFVLGGAPSLPPQGRPREEEQFCQTLWGFAQYAEAAGVPLIEFMAGLRAAAA